RPCHSDARWSAGVTALLKPECPNPPPGKCILSLLQPSTQRPCRRADIGEILPTRGEHSSAWGVHTSVRLASKGCLPRVATSSWILGQGPARTTRHSCPRLR